MNILHSVNKDRITPEHFLACIEIPAGSQNKYELDVESGALMLDRILYTATHYPQNYGFIPRTWGNDNDPLDVLVFCSAPIVPMALCRCYPIGMLNMVDSGEGDEKIIAVCQNDPVFSSYKDIHELPSHYLEEISHFFRRYKELEKGKKTEIGGFKGRHAAIECIRRGRLRYDEHFKDR